MWVAEKEILETRDLDENTRHQSLRGKVPLLRTTGASVLIHALALALLFTTVVNPFAWEADRQPPPVIQVTLDSLGAKSVPRPTPILLSASRRENINGDNSESPYDVVSETQQASQLNLNKSNQESLSPAKTDPTDNAPLTVSNLQLTNLSGEAIERLEPAAGSPTSANFGGPNRFPATGEGTSLVKPRYILTPHPAYPAVARSQGQEGVVLLSVEIQANGRTGQVAVKKSSGYALLDQSAQNAVRSWRFEPARRLHTPQAMIVDIPIRFSLKDNQ